MPEYLTIQEVADILRVNVQTVRRYLRENKLKGSKSVGRWRVHRDEVERFMQETQMRNKK